MKNCELNVRTIDEGSIDENSGMNFSEYIAILSGDTSLLEKSKMEKKIAVLESLRNAHHKEVVRSRFQLETLEGDKEVTQQTLTKLIIDETNYQAQLQFDKEGIKLNPLQLNDCHSIEPEAIGNYLIKKSVRWKFPTNGEGTTKIGTLYNFDLMIRRQKETWEDKGMFDLQYKNTFYAESKETGIKYSWNNGYINIDNPKIAARYFLNAIDRVGSLKEKYENKLHNLEQDIPLLQQLVTKPFEKERELMELRKDVSKLEREISIQIQRSQMKQHCDTDNTAATIIETPLIKMEDHDVKPEKTLLIKKEIIHRKKNGVRF